MSENEFEIIYISSDILKEVEQELTFDEATFSKHQDRLELQKSNKGLYLIARYNKSPVGHVFISWKGVDPKISGKNFNCPNLEDLFVSPAHRSSGVGTKLIKECIRMAKQKGFSRVGLGVEKTNLKAAKLYSKFKFKEYWSYDDEWYGKDRKGNQTGPFSASVKYFISPIINAED